MGQLRLTSSNRAASRADKRHPNAAINARNCLVSLVLLACRACLGDMESQLLWDEYHVGMGGFGWAIALLAGQPTSTQKG